MGNKTPNILTIQGKIQHPRLGLIQIKANSQAALKIPAEYRQIIALQSHAFNRSEYNRWQQQLMFLANVNLLKNPNSKTSKTNSHQQVRQSYKMPPLRLNQQIEELMFLPLACSIKQEGFCGSSCLLEIYYPNYAIVLRDQIKDRWKVEKFYSEEELWYLLYNLILLQRYLEPLDRRIGDVHPNNILINEQDGVMKIITHFSIPKQLQNFQVICQSQLQDAFLAPQEIQYDSIKRCKYPSGINQNLAEIFTIGMTVLQAGTLEQSTFLYDRGPYRINQNKLNQNISLFRSKYGPYLSNILQGMLALKPKNRRTSKELFELLNPFEGQIVNLQSFTSKVLNKQMSRYGSNTQYSNPGIVNNSLMNNSGSTAKQMKLINDQMCETKILGQFPPHYKYTKNTGQSVPNTGRIKSTLGSHHYSEIQTNLNPFKQITEQGQARTNQNARLYSPRITRSTFIN